MNKCENWINPPSPYSDARCLATRETEWCSCGGDQTKCDFYPEIREKANIEKQELAPVRHGWWKRSGPLLECQCCGEICSQLGGNAGKGWNYCPSCGAKMDGGSRCKTRYSRMPDIQAAIAHYSMGINEDIFSPEVAKYATLAIEGLRKMAENEK